MRPPSNSRATYLGHAWALPPGKWKKGGLTRHARSFHSWRLPEQGRNTRLVRSERWRVLPGGGPPCRALRLSEHLIREKPSLGQQPEFRNFVIKSEKFQGGIESILPRRSRSLLGLFGIGDRTGYTRRQIRVAVCGSAILLATAGLVLSNEYFRRNRSIFVLNACGQDVEVQIDDDPPRSISGLGRVVTGEGHHRIKLTGAVQETHEVDLHTRYIDRWFKKPVWVLNPGKEAIVLESTIYYAAKPRPHDRRYIAGESFLYRADVDYPFEPPPDKLKVNSDRNEVAKTSLQWQRGEEVRVFEELVAQDRSAAFAFAERRVRQLPDRKDLLEAFLAMAKPAELPQIEAFLKSGLERRPVLIPWHCAFQTLAEYEGKDADVLALYERLERAEPGNGSLLYLRGRLEPDWEKQESYYRRASQADARLPWPHMALAARAEAGARWKEALLCLHKAQELRLDPELISDALQTARLGSGDALALAGRTASPSRHPAGRPGRNRLALRGAGRRWSAGDD